MFRKLKPALSFALLLALMLPFTVSARGFNHGRVEVGDYTFVIGFRTEPAYQGEPNGLDLAITNTKTEEPVLDLAETLKAEVIYGASKQELEVRAQFGRPGAYTAYLIPTEAGDYTWHIWGEIEGTPVDVSMTSSPQGTFGAVRAKSEVSFPAPEPTVKELGAQIQQASTMGIIGAVLGAIGIVLGFLGMRKKQS